MDPPSLQTTPSLEEDGWDTEGFVIPSLGIENPDQNKIDSPEIEDSKQTSVKDKKQENIYLGPHGAPPSQSKQELNSSSHKQKLKEADKKYSGTGRENKVENLRELVGGGKMPINTSKSAPRDWLDPHCHETQFERRYC